MKDIKLHFIIFLLLANLLAICWVYTLLVDSMWETTDVFVKSCSYALGNE